MKFFKNIAFIISISLIVISCKEQKQKPTNGYLISGELKGYDGDYIYLDIDRKIVDSAKVSNGRFVFTGKLDRPKVSIIGNKDRSKSGLVYLDNATIEVTLEFIDDGKTLDRKIDVKGSPAHDIFMDFGSIREEVSEKYKGASRASSDEYLSGQVFYYLEGQPEKINLTSLEQVYFLYRMRIKTHSFPIENTKKLLSLFKDKYENEEHYKLIEKRLKAGELRVEGTPFINYTAKDVNGKEVKLSDYYGKSYIFVDLWASWCGPCRAENPNYKKALKRFKDKGFQIFSISFDDKKEDWLKAIKEDRIQDFTHVSNLMYEGDPVADAYYISAIPDNFILDKEGKIVENHLRGEELIEILERLYSN